MLEKFNVGMVKVFTHHIYRLVNGKSLTMSIRSYNIGALHQSILILIP